MARFLKDRQNWICCLCVILAVVCTFCLFMPHMHQCDDAQCAVCALLAIYEMLWLPAGIVTALFTGAFLLNGYECRVDACAAFSLVQQKVKLSD